MTVTIHQPCYLPWLGYFDRMATADIFVLLDTVPMSGVDRENFVNRNRIRAPGKAGEEGECRWLTIPLERKGLLRSPIRDVCVSQDIDWQRKHLNSLQASYGKTPGWKKHREFFKSFYSCTTDKLQNVLLPQIYYLAWKFSIPARLILASKLEVRGSGSQLLLDICHELGAKTYLSGPFGCQYLDLARFKGCGVEVRFHDYRPPAVALTKDGFALSAVDWLFRNGESLP
ncbi:MAG: WbqC family protein [Nitrospinota bacterium]